MTSEAQRPNDSSAFRLLRLADDVVFSIEQTIVATFLSAMTVMVFLDVVSRRLTARDSKVGDLLARMFSVGEQSRQTLDNVVAPIVSAIIGIAIIWFAFNTVRRKTTDDKEEAPSAFDPRTLGLTAATAAGLAGLGWLISAEQQVDVDGVTLIQPLVPSKYFYMLLYVLIAGPWIGWLSKNKPAGWQRTAIALVVGGVVLAGFAFTFFPAEYSWSLEVSGIMILWVGALGASICAYAGKHIRLQALARTAPPQLERYARGLGFLFTALFCIALATLSFRSMVQLAKFGLAFEQTGIPDWVASASLPIAFGLAALRFLGAAVSALRGGSYGVTDDAELAAAAAHNAGQEDSAE